MVRRWEGERGSAFSVFQNPSARISGGRDGSLVESYANGGASPTATGGGRTSLFAKSFSHSRVREFSASIHGNAELVEARVVPFKLRTAPNQSGFDDGVCDSVLAV